MDAITVSESLELSESARRVLLSIVMFTPAVSQSFILYSPLTCPTRRLNISLSPVIIPLLWENLS